MPRFSKVVRTTVPVEVSEEELMTLGDAAKELGISLSAVDALFNRRQAPLTRFVDEAEPNPTRQTRLLRAEVRAEKAARRGRRDDGRLNSAR